MGAGPSMERLLYDSVRAGEDRTIRSLHREGARINVSTSRIPPALSLSSPHAFKLASSCLFDTIFSVDALLGKDATDRRLLLRQSSTCRQDPHRVRG